MSFEIVLSKIRLPKCKNGVAKTTSGERVSECRIVRAPGDRRIDRDQRRLAERAALLANDLKAFLVRSEFTESTLHYQFISAVLSA
jgi:hypothetical protein